MDLTALLGDEAETLLGYTAKGITEGRAGPAGPDFLDRTFVYSDRSPTVLRNLGVAVRPRSPRPARATCRSSRSTRASSTPAAASFAPNPIYFDPANIVKLAVEARLQRRRHHVRRARGGVPAVRPQDPVHRQAQPQRAAHLPEQVRPGDVRLGAARRGTWARPASGPRSTGARRSRDRQLQEVVGGVRGGPPARHVHRAVVLPAQRRRSRSTGSTTTRRPTSPARRTTSASRSQADIIKQKLPESNGGFERA